MRARNARPEGVPLPLWLQLVRCSYTDPYVRRALTMWEAEQWTDARMLAELAVIQSKRVGEPHKRWLDSELLKPAGPILICCVGKHRGELPGGM